MKKALLIALLLSSVYCFGQDYIAVISGNTSPQSGTSEGYFITWVDGYGNSVSPPELTFYEWSSDMGEIYSPQAGSCAINWPPISSGSTVTFSYETLNSARQYSYLIINVSEAPPQAPEAYGASSASSTSLTVGWSTVSEATRYEVDLSTTPSFFTFVYGYQAYSTTSTTLNLVGLSPGTGYYYRVRSFDSDGYSSENSNVVELLTAPATPAGLSASNFTGTSFTANWSSVSTAQYRLDVSTDNSFSSFVNGYQDLLVTGTSQNVAGLVPGTTYYYRVRAFNFSGTSGNSGAISALTLPPAPAVSNPTNITSLSFVANWSSTASATSYRIDVSTTSDFASTVSGLGNLYVDGTNVTIPWLIPNTIYYYRVRAENASGASANSGVMSLRTGPAAPIATQATDITETSFIANWNAVSEATGYLLYVSSTSDFSSFVAGYNGLQVTSASQKVSGLAPAAYYYFRVVSVNQISASPYSNTVQLLFKPQRNYIRTITPTVSGFTTSTALETATKDQRLAEYVFFDGLGRPEQNVQKQYSPAGNDLVKPIAYDNYGRKAKQYLPVVVSESTGWYKDDIFSSSFYLTGNGTIPVDSKPYAETIFEASPLNRVLKQGAPGEAWQPNDDAQSLADKTIKKRYELNGSQEVYSFTYDALTGLITLSTDPNQRYYSPNELYRSRMLNETNDEVIEFVDKEGRMVCKKAQYRAVEGERQYTCTYYLYDNFGNLVVVLPPEGVRKMESMGSGLADWAFQYKYDGRRRMTHKKVPGADWVYMVYDSRDRLVMTQDGEQRNANKWSFTKYDVLNRPVVTGIYTHGTLVDQAYMSDQASTACEVYDGNAATHGYTNVVFPTTNLEVLTVTYYDDYLFRSLTPGSDFYYRKNEVTGQYQNPDASATLAFNRVVGHVTGTKVKVLEENKYLWRVNYYDDEYRLVQTIGSNDLSGTDCVTNTYDFVGKVLKTHTTHTSTGVSNVGAAGIKVLRNFKYDHAGRLLETWHKVGSGTEVLLVKNNYNELGQLVAKKLHRSEGQYVTADPAVGQPGVLYATEINSTEYSSSQHTYIATQKVRLQPGFKVLSGNPFKGRIGYSQQDAEAHNNAVDASLQYRQVIDYRYNIRGWLTRINNSDLSVVEDNVRDYFGMTLFYNETATGLSNDQLFNGNISALKWSANLGLGITNAQQGLNEPTENAYTFSYDTLNRLKSASFHTKASTWSASAAYHENNFKYDLNGNIRALNRTTTGGTSMDQLIYAYSGNQLLKVSDASGNMKGFSDGANTGNDYAYDDNGNMRLDENKDIDALTYNHLNLPYVVTKGTGDYLKYTYDATGVKLRQEVYAPNNVPKKKTTYAGEFFYENDTLKFINHQEGRVVMIGTPEYEYHLKDHLGNVRLTFTTQAAVDVAKATLETASASSEQSKFLYREEAVRINSPLFDHTNQGSTFYATRLLGGNTNEIYGLAKSLSVMPGDVINIEVFAKYLDRSESSGWTTALQNLMATIAAGTAPAGTLVDGGTVGSIGTATPSYTALLDKSSQGGTAPKAYLNYIVFDRNFDPILSESGFKRVTTAAKENGSDIAHERLFKENLVIREPGYVYIYLSNESLNSVEVFFDDFKVEQIKSPVVQMDDYYPFGMSFNSSSRENITTQDYKFNGKEEQKELGLGWLDYGPRQYDPAISRFNTIDIFSGLSSSQTSYGYAGNDPVNSIDIGGNFQFPVELRQKYPRVTAYLEKMLPHLQHNQVVVNTIDKHTHLGKEAIKKDFQNGSGPVINPRDLLFPNWGKNSIIGRLDINEQDILQQMENGLATNDPKYQEFTDVYIFMAITVIVHEYVHDASRRSKYKLPTGWGRHDEGSNWTYDAFGRFIDWPTEQMAVENDTKNKNIAHDTAQSYLRDTPRNSDIFIGIFNSPSNNSEMKQKKTASPYHPHKFKGNE